MLEPKVDYFPPMLYIISKKSFIQHSGFFYIKICTILPLIFVF